MSKIRVLIADDHPIVRTGSRQLLESEPDIDVVDEAGDGEETLEKVRAHRPDVLLLDIEMPRLGGLEAAQMVRDASPETRIVIFTMHEKKSFIRKALQAGALGYLLKSGPWEEIPKAIRSAHAGRYFLNAFVTSSVVSTYLKNHRKGLSDKNYQSLTDRERQIFLLLVDGNSNSQIGDILCISPKTVEKHRLCIVDKLGIENPIDMVKYAVRIGLVDPEIWKS